MRWVWRWVRYLPGNCDVCGGSQLVTLRIVGRTVGPVVACPHCSHPGPLELLVASMENRPAPGGGAAA